MWIAAAMGALTLAGCAGTAVQTFGFRSAIHAAVAAGSPRAAASYPHGS